MTNSYSPTPSQTATLLFARASAHPLRAAFIDAAAAKSVSWQTVAKHCEQLRSTFRAKAQGARQVGLLISEPTEFCRTYLAALAAGVSIAPLDPRLTAEELEAHARALDLTDLLCDDSAAPVCHSLGLPGPAVWCTSASGANLRQPGRFRIAAGLSRPPAVIQATSGTGGSPKLVPLTEVQLLHVAGQIAHHHGLTADDRCLCPLPLFHINAQVVGVLSTLVCGGSLVVERRFESEGFWDTAAASACTWLNLVPAIISLLADTPPPLDLSERIRFARSASSTLAESVHHRFEAASGIGILETYGMTEAASQITANPLSVDKRKPGTVGLPVGVELRVVDEDGGDLVGADEVGMVELRGAGVIENYLDPGETSRRLPARSPKGWLRTGDLGWCDQDGFLTLVGRDDDVINRGGEKVYPREIEEVLLRDKRVSAAAAVGQAHPRLGAQPVAFVTTALPRGSTACVELVDDLNRLCASALTKYKRPVEITVADLLPASATGKISRKVLASEVAVSGAST